VRRLGIALALVAVGGAGCTGEPRLAPPAGFPADFPLPPGAVLRSSQDLGERGLNLVFVVGGEPGAVAAAQGARLEAAGWRLVAEVPLERGLVASWRRGDRSAAVAVSAAGRDSLLSVGYQARPPAGAP